MNGEDEQFAHGVNGTAPANACKTARFIWIASYCEFATDRRLNCASNDKNRAAHIWNRRDAAGFTGATACVVVPWFADRYERGADWRSLAWWIHDHLPYSNLVFFPKLAAFNIRWHEQPERKIESYIVPKGCLTKPGMANHEGSHASVYARFPAFRTL